MAEHWQVSRPPTKPRIVYDGDCTFCRRWIARWEQLTGAAVDYETYQSAASQFPEIPQAEFAHAVKLIEPNGTVHSAAAAVFRSLYLACQKRWLWWMYLYLPLFAAISEAVYRFIARHRGGVDRIDRWLIGTETLRPTYFVTRDLFLRLLGLVYFVAFFQYYLQADGLIGSHGILPLFSHIEAIRHYFDSQQIGITRYWQVPTVFWIRCGDKALHAVCWTGIVASAGIVLGLARAVCLAIAWVLYLSLTVAGQQFLSFQWDALLLESGFIAIFLAPWQWGWKISCQYRVSMIALWLQRWLLFRLMFLSGLVKITWGDVTWKSWEVLRYHYETQPIPTWTSWYFDKAPEWFQWISLIFMWIAELGAPWLIWGPRKMRLRAFAIIVLMQILIAATGNYGFFNLLSIVLCLTLLDDALLARRWRASVSSQVLSKVRRFCGFSAWITGPIAAVILVITVLQIGEAVHGVSERPLSLPIGRRGQTIRAIGQALEWVRQAAAPLQSVNSYGLFRVMTRQRNEIIIEASDDLVHWREYQFKFKPGDLQQRPRFFAPLMPRLDWQMWFAALGNIRQNPWVLNLMIRLLQNHSEVTSLLGDNPFADHRPQYIRALLYEYHFTTADERAATGAWWKRQYAGLYCPIISQEQLKQWGVPEE